MSDEATKQKIIKVMENVPPMPVVTQKLLEVMRQDDSSAEDVTKVLSSDAALAGKILKLVNSSFYGVPREVSTVTRAVVLIGFSGVRNLAVSFGTVETLRKIGNQGATYRFWEHAIAAAAGAQALVPVLGTRIDPEEAFVAGLMHDIGHFVLASAVPEVFAEALATPGKPLVVEQELFGMTHPRIGQKLLQYWQLPGELCDAIRYHHDVNVAAKGDQPLTTLVALADVMACIYGGAIEQPISEADLSRIIRLRGISLRDFTGALHQMDQKVEELTSFLKLAGENSGQGDSTSEANEACGVVVVSADEERCEWVNCLLDHCGHTSVPMKTYFAQAVGTPKVDLVLLDPQCLTKSQLVKILPFLKAQNVRIATLDDGGEVAASSDLRELYPTLNFVFSRQDIDELMQTQPV